MNHESIRNELTMCLLTKDELEKGPVIWFDYEDPFEAWGEDGNEEDSWHGLVLP